MPKNLSKDHQRKAGWGRARQWAEWRKIHPSRLEQIVQEFLSSNNVLYEIEYEITHANGMPQWFDVYIPACNVVLEVDGSHGWHNHNGSSSKMALFDELKSRYCQDHQITLLWIRKDRVEIDLQYALEVINGTARGEVLSKGARISDTLIPF